MKRIAAIAALAALALVAGGAPQSATGKSQASAAPPTENEAEIWQAFENRSIRQADEWFAIGEFARATRTLELRAELNPADYEIATSLIWMYGNMEEKDRALQSAIRYRLRNPEDPEAYFPEAELYFRERMYAKVVPLLEESLKHGTPHPNSYRLLANAWARLGFARQSVRVWDIYLSMMPDDAAAKMNRERQAALIGD